MTDEINNPKHYQMFPDMQAIDVISASLSRDELIGYLKGNALKYRLRAGEKGPAEKCIAKANWYQAKLREVMGQPEMPDSFGQQNMWEPAAEIDDDNPRNLPIHQGGELAEFVYAAIDASSIANAFCRECGAHPLYPHHKGCSQALTANCLTEEYVSGNAKRHPETPRHHCGACGLNHALHQCAGGQKDG